MIQNSRTMSTPHIAVDERLCPELMRMQPNLVGLCVLMDPLPRMRLTLLLFHLPNLPRLPPTKFLRTPMIRPIRRRIEEHTHFIHDRADRCAELRECACPVAVLVFGQRTRGHDLCWC